ncbi:MAG: OmpA family protein, partial [Flavobacteriales bacterium]|nr:OmpA family protein [Flavobacteriales bacterium]
ISGHTDNTGVSSTNLILSQNRAKSVQDYLISKGVDKARLTFKGFGETKPIADNATDEGKRKNRRVEFIVVE